MTDSPDLWRPIYANATVVGFHVGLMSPTGTQFRGELTVAPGAVTFRSRSRTFGTSRGVPLMRLAGPVVHTAREIRIIRVRLIPWLTQVVLTGDEQYGEAGPALVTLLPADARRLHAQLAAGAYTLRQTTTWWL